MNPHPPARHRDVRRWALVSLTLVVAALAVVGIKACSDQLAAGRAQAEPAAEQFTRLYNDAEYETIYASSDPALKKAMSAEELAQRLDSVRARLGNVVGKSFGCVGTGGGGEPLQIEYRTTFENGEAWETFLWQVNGSEVALFAYAVETGFESGSSDWEVLVAPARIRPQDHSCTANQVYFYKNDPAYRAATSQ